jgi:catabolite regulation protein CreA
MSKAKRRFEIPTVKEEEFSEYLELILPKAKVYRFWDPGKDNIMYYVSDDDEMGLLALRLKYDK